ncbi:MAG: hypothetical protein LBJ93_00170 [Clostridiales bacterium]|nr:hypothetical protein [Clostridiales bacterium]
MDSAYLHEDIQVLRGFITGHEKEMDTHFSYIPSSKTPIELNGSLGATYGNKRQTRLEWTNQNNKDNKYRYNLELLCSKVLAGFHSPNSRISIPRDFQNTLINSAMQLRDAVLCINFISKNINNSKVFDLANENVTTQLEEVTTAIFNIVASYNRFINSPQSKIIFEAIRTSSSYSGPDVRADFLQTFNGVHTVGNDDRLSSKLSFNVAVSEVTDMLSNLYQFAPNILENVKSDMTSDDVEAINDFISPTHEQSVVPLYRMDFINDQHCRYTGETEKASHKSNVKLAITSPIVVALLAAGVLAAIGLCTETSPKSLGIVGAAIGGFLLLVGLILKYNLKKQKTRIKGKEFRVAGAEATEK